jgi:hypothetical protein
MKKVLLVVLLVAVTVGAQTRINISAKVGAGIPTGSCAPHEFAIDTSTGEAYSCNNGNWQSIAGASINVKSRGAIGDGASHPLSTRFSTLAAARSVYPFVTSLSQEIDYAAFKKASNDALGADGSEHGSTDARLNLTIVIPCGTYNFGSDTWTIRNASGIEIRGSGQTCTILKSSSTVLQFDGLWYSSIHDLQIQTTSSGATVALDIDGNVPGHPYPTRGVQSVELRNLLVTAGGSEYGIAVCRKGGSGGQCSGMVYTNLAISNAAFAGYYQNGYNALLNTWIGGDVQNYPKFAVYLVAGSIHIFNVSFESTRGYIQVANKAYDLSFNSGGTGDGILVYGCRSESLQFVISAGSQLVDVRAFTHRPAFSTWSSRAALPLNYIVSKTGLDGHSHMYRVTKPGNTGNSEPSWPATGTVADGSVVWTMTNYTVADIFNGSIDFATSTLDSTAEYAANDARYLRDVEVKTPHYTLSLGDAGSAATTNLLVYPDIAASNVTIALEGGQRPSNTGRPLVISRANTDPHSVTITGVVGGSVVLKGGTLDSVYLVYMGGGAGAAGWRLINSHSDITARDVFLDREKCPPGQTAPLFINDTGKIVKGKCS